MEHNVSSISAHGATAVITVVGVILVLVAFKAVKLIFKLVFGVIALGLLVGAMWWFFQGQ